MATANALLRKADLAIADIAASGGYLLPEQGASFIRKLILQPTLIKQCRVIEMNSPQRKINKIGFGKRILRAAQSEVPLGAPTASQLGGRAKPTTSQINLTTHEQIAQVNLPYDVLEDNIERATVANNELPNTGPGGLRQTIIDLMAERVATDIEELGLMADTSYVNPSDADDQAYLSQQDGWLKIASSQGNVVDAGNQAITRSVFKAGLQTLPKQYLRNRAAMKQFVSNNNEIEFRDTLANRVGQLGDGMLTGDLPAYAYGTLVSPVQLMPEDRGLFTDPQNLIFGIQRQVSMEFDKDITARTYMIVVTMRITFAVEEPDALVYYENLGTDLAA